jgi:hypothetical protein
MRDPSGMCGVGEPVRGSLAHRRRGIGSAYRAPLASALARFAVVPCTRRGDRVGPIARRCHAPRRARAVRAVGGLSWCRNGSRAGGAAAPPSPALARRVWLSGLAVPGLRPRTGHSAVVTLDTAQPRTRCVWRCGTLDRASSASPGDRLGRRVRAVRPARPRRGRRLRLLAAAARAALWTGCAGAAAGARTGASASRRRASRRRASRRRASRCGSSMRSAADAGPNQQPHRYTGRGRPTR